MAPVSFLLQQRAFTRALNGECGQAFADIERAVALFEHALPAARTRLGDPRRSVRFGYVLAMCGHRDRARKLADERRRDGFCDAGVYAVMGDRAAAFGCLDQMYSRRDFGLVRVPAEPWYASLRVDPRFDELLRRIAYPRE